MLRSPNVQYKPVKMLDVDMNKDPVKAPQNLAANLLEVLGEGNVFCHGENRLICDNVCCPL